MMRNSTEGWPTARKLGWALGLSLTVMLAACSHSDSDDDDDNAGTTPPTTAPVQCTADAHCAPAP